MSALPHPTPPALLNRYCHCRTTDVQRIHHWIERHLQTSGVHEPLVDTHPHLFSETAVFVERRHLDAAEALIGAVDFVVHQQSYQKRALADAAPIALADNRTHGVLLGFDFHLGADGPRLIEINTNAGGALLNTVLLRAQLACCAESPWFPTERAVSRIESSLIAMFQCEWTLARGDSSSLRRIAIVDDIPSTQFLYPEFVLFKQLFESKGWETVIADPGALTLIDGRLRHDSGAIDLVYNRLTDFYLERPEHAHLRDAHLMNAVVMTPHPRAHALYANKRNLTLLSDAQQLRAMGIQPQTMETLVKYIPQTQAVASRCREAWWTDRKGWFFKPVSGYAGRGAYRGDKVTRKTFAEVMDKDYVAQIVVPPGLRHHLGDSEPLRWDLRVYAYEGKPLLHAARLYAGQTTNFRTPGGGFAPVFVAA